MMIMKRGTYKGIVVSKNNERTMVQLKNVRYIPEKFCKLISLTQAMRSGYDVFGRKNKITLS